MFKNKSIACLFFLSSVLGLQVLAMNTKNSQAEKRVVRPKNGPQSRAQRQTRGPQYTKIAQANESMQIYQESVINAFNGAKEKSLKEANLPLIGHIVTENNKASWKGLITYGFEENEFSSKDLKWVIQEFSIPETLKKSHGKLLFELIINEEPNKEPSGRKQKLIELLTVVDLLKRDYLKDSTKANRGAQSHSEYRNLLTEMIEHSYFEAFTITLKKFPEMIPLIFSNLAIKRQEYVGLKNESDWFWNRSYVYEEKSYKLIEWLMRDKKIDKDTAIKHIYIDRTKDAKAKNNNYIEAGKIIIEQAIEILQDSDPIYALSQLLYKQNDITEELSRKVAKKYTGNEDARIFNETKQ
jgi:hypothetical protein